MFKYRKELGNNKVAVLAGQFLSVSETPREDGKYLMMYNPSDESGHVTASRQIMYVPQDFGALCRSMSKSPANHKASVIAPWGAFIKKYGEDAVKNAPNIEDATTRIVETDKN